MNRQSNVAAASAAALVISLSACAGRDVASMAGPTPLAAASISFEAGPCFGFCPVYNAAISSTGEVAFDGVRHTATLGHRSVKLGAVAYRAFAAALAPYRPASGTTEATACDTRISDQQHYRLVRTAPDGTKTTLEHDRGCRSKQNDALNVILQRAPEHLGIEAFARQSSRPGASRG
jgi:hypothetical protein